VAAFVDDPAMAAEAIRVQVAVCPDCASLASDLRLLATASANLAAPTRRRDFRLSPADAARLATMPEEPVAVAGRLGNDMTTPANDHATHDPLLIAADLDGTLDARDVGRVGDWLAACADCERLRSDLAALALATRTLPTPMRPRDFQLTQADAGRRSAGGWRRVLAAIASPRDTFTRPLAVGLTTLGLAGLVIANIPTATLFGVAGGAGTAAGPGGAVSSQVELSHPKSGAPLLPGAELLPDAAASAKTDITGEAVPQPSTADRNAGLNGSVPSAGAAPQGTPVDEALVVDDGVGPSLLVIASLAMLLTGIALALLRWGARRLGDG
jgi:hypothetical protein